MENKIRVLIVDDQVIVRKILKRGLSEDPNIEIVGEASDPYIARDLIVKLDPDVMTLDVEMPRMNGLEFLQKLIPQYPMRVIMVSSLTQTGKLITLKALEAGALDFVAKPDGGPAALESMISEFTRKIKIAAGTNINKVSYKKAGLVTEKKGLSANISKKVSSIKLIAIGASTGGTKALNDIIARLPANIPATVIVQHMPAGFTKMFAERLNKVYSHLDIKEAEQGDIIIPGRVLIAPGDFQLGVKKHGNSFRVNIFEYEKVSGHRPSVDVLFSSIAKCGLGKAAIAVLLTGMGKDGAKGLNEIRQGGGRTIGQDEESSIVYGMPRVAYELGAVEYQLPLARIAGKISALL